MDLLSAAQPSAVRTRVSLVRGGLPLLLALFLVDACASADPTPCDGFADRKLGVTGTEYRACAGEILAALDALEPPLRAIVHEKASQDRKEKARQAYGRLRLLIRRTGMERDFWGDSGTIAMKWPNSAVREFNAAAFHACAQYGSALGYPNEDNLGQASQFHDDARRYYDAIR